MKRFFWRVATLQLALLGLLNTAAYAGDVFRFYNSQPFNVTLPTGTQILYPPFDASMADIRVHGDPSYHYPDLDIDLSIDMLNLSEVHFTLHGNVSFEVIATPRLNAPESSYLYEYQLNLELMQPNPAYSFALGPNTFIFSGTGPGADMFVRNFEISFTLNETTDLLGGWAVGNFRGFDRLNNFQVNAMRSNFVLDELSGFAVHYIWPGHYWIETIGAPPDAYVTALPPVWSGIVMTEYHFSLNYEAIDFALLFDSFRDSFHGWDLSAVGAVEIIPHGNDHAAQMTTGSSVSMSRWLDTPDRPLILMFNYAFLKENGTLDVYLDEEILLTLGADDAPLDVMMYQRLLVADRNLLERTGNRLTFMLHGPTGSQVLLDNIGVYILSGTQTLTDLDQTIRVLKSLAGITADLQEILRISEDGKIGLAEGIYLLQKAAELRQD